VEAAYGPRFGEVSRHGALASTIVGLSRALANSLVSETIARQPGFLQSLDPRAKLIGLVGLVLAAALSHRIWVIIALWLVSVLLGLLSGVGLRIMATRVWLAVLLFTGIIAFPALFLTPGTPVLTSPDGNLRITEQGITAAVLLIARVESAATLTTLLALTTPWMQLLKSLRLFGVPQEVVMMLNMTHRYIFVLAESASQMLESRTSRTVGILDRATQRRLMARTAGVLMGKSVELGNDVYVAMHSRGFRGDAKILNEFRMTSKDLVAIGGFLLVAILAIWMGRA
jgi:cobalt ECF transporter T component CbiQ